MHPTLVQASICWSAKQIFMIGKCNLCLKDNVELQLSHVIPKFVWRWFKKTSPGKLRTSQEPNKRIQDGPKAYLLCTDCEQSLGNWENLFYEKLFLPLHNPKPVTEAIPYGPWALKFAVSISWRVMKFFEVDNPNSHLTPVQKQLEVQAMETWRKFMLSEVENPDIFSQHLIPVDVIQSYQGPNISPFLNRYFLRSVHIDVIATKKSAHVYTKICRLIIFGRIHEKQPRQWKGLQLKLKKGTVKLGKYHLPPGIVEYWNTKADETQKALNSISPRQQEKLDKNFEENIDDYIGSEVFRAMEYDIYHSGDEAFSKKDGN